MIAVIFEVVPHKEQKSEYFRIAADLSLILGKIKGFISIERFQSFNDPEKILSLSFWKDEESIKEWRNEEMHRLAQSNGRESIFRDYRLRIANVVRDYGMSDRKEAPVDGRVFHDKET